MCSGASSGLFEYKIASTSSGSRFHCSKILAVTVSFEMPTISFSSSDTSNGLEIFFNFALKSSTFPVSFSSLEMMILPTSSIKEAGLKTARSLALIFEYQLYIRAFCIIEIFKKS